MAGTENVINNLKLRASYGVAGNADIDLNAYQPLLGYSADYGGEAAIFPETLGNKDGLTWETSHTLDAGLDFNLFDNRVNGAMSYYRRESRDLLLDLPLSRTSGFNTQYQTVGTMENSV